MLGVYHPFIAENGAAAFVPARYFGDDLKLGRTVGGYQAIEFAGTYRGVVDRLQGAAERLRIGIVGFGDMSAEQVAGACGTTLCEARLAKVREYDEPFRLVSANLIAQHRLVRALRSAGLVCRERGMFIHAGTAVDPGPAVTTLSTLYASALGPVLTLACDPVEAMSIGRRTDLSLVRRGSNRAVEGAAEWLQEIVDRVREVRETRAEALMSRSATNTALAGSSDKLWNASLRWIAARPH